jgi:hypothetical protein
MPFPTYLYPTFCYVLSIAWCPQDSMTYLCGGMKTKPTFQTPPPPLPKCCDTTAITLFFMRSWLRHFNACTLKIPFLLSPLPSYSHLQVYNFMLHSALCIYPIYLHGLPLPPVCNDLYSHSTKTKDSPSKDKAFTTAQIMTATLA